jgi:hypothetical protein
LPRALAIVLCKYVTVGVHYDIQRQFSLTEALGVHFMETSLVSLLVCVCARVAMRDSVRAGVSLWLCTVFYRALLVCSIVHIVYVRCCVGFLRVGFIFSRSFR